MSYPCLYFGLTYYSHRFIMQYLHFCHSLFIYFRVLPEKAVFVFGVKYLKYNVYIYNNLINYKYFKGVTDIICKNTKPVDKYLLFAQYVNWSASRYRTNSKRNQSIQAVRQFRFTNKLTRIRTTDWTTVSRKIKIRGIGYIINSFEIQYWLSSSGI